MDQNHIQNQSQKSIFDNPISLSIIVSAFLIAASIIAGAYMIRSGSFGSAGAPGDTAAGAPVKIADRKDQPTIGNANAKLTIYEFGDFQCPYCKNFFADTYPTLKANYIDTGKVKIVFRHFPLTQIHQNAQISSEAAECASRQGAFEAYYSILYTKGQGDGTGLDAGSLKTYASQLGLNMPAFNKCLDNHEAKTVVDQDAAVGSKAGVSGTPSFVIDGQLVVGAQPAAAFEQIIEKAL